MSESFAPRAADIVTALSLLGRVPVPGSAIQPGRNAQAAWAWPVAGAILGTLAALAGGMALVLGLPPAAAAGVALAAQALLTGALHEDGLADTADGLWGGHSRERRLEIMKDSRIGTYGVLALALGLGLRWAALAALMQAGMAWAAALIAAGALSRAPMVVLAHRLAPARPGGLSHSTGRPPKAAETLALSVALGVGLLLLGLAVIPAALAALLTTLAIAQAARNKIGGQTGDILGATQQLAEIGVLLALAARA